MRAINPTRLTFPAMRPNGIRLSFTHRTWLFGAFATAFGTGTAWWVLHHWFQVNGEFGPAPRPLEHLLIRLHGAAAMLTLVLLGSLLTLHVKRAWLARRNRTSGGLLLALNALLALTGYALYYAGGESLRAFASNAHLALGFALPLALVLHLTFGRRTRPGDDDDPRAVDEDNSLG